MRTIVQQDTAGQERFHALGPIYYRDADGMPSLRSIKNSNASKTQPCFLSLFAAALLVFDITDADSFLRVKTWVKELRKMAGAGC